MSLVVIGSSCTVSYQVLGPGLALRLLVSMGFVLLMIQVVLGVLGRLQRRLVEQAITDPLTGTYNRRHLQTQLDRLNLPSGEMRGPTPALLAIDIDHFKRINDTHGHATGDAVLRALVALIATRQRLGDVLFRTGGEEFMLLLPRTPPAAAQALAEDLRRRVEAAALLPDRPVTVSIGIASLRPEGGVDAWLRAADAALYRAKQGGRNRVELAP
jgi:diguanylate cyclase (GGDEF)-like protein